MTEGRGRAFWTRVWGRRTVSGHRAYVAALCAACVLLFCAPARADPPADPVEATEAQTDWCNHRLLAPFRSYTHRDEAGAWDEPDGAPGTSEAYAAEIPAIWRDVRDALKTLGPTAAIVAMVPDPIDTGYVYQFEEIWSAVQLGVEQHRYLRDETWLPWEDSHLEKKDTRPLDEACRLRVPGALLLRRNETARAGASGVGPATIVVLFVGETPSEGIHKAPLGKALALARSLESFAPGRIRIVGPTYSGSAHSLREVLDDAPEPGAAGAGGIDGGGTTEFVEIVSGSATTRAIGSVLTHETPARHVRFRRATLDDASVEQLFFPWLAERAHFFLPAVDRPNRVGLLVEEGTLFGVNEAATAAEAQTHPTIILQFRRGIADLERAHAVQAAQARAEASAEAPPPLPPISTVLDPSFDERLTTRDTAPDPSPKRLAALDLELRNLLAEVAREGLAFLAIRATDPGDAVFLAQQVRSVAPDVRLVFFSSDVLLLHPAFASQFRGSLVVSPYPFFGTSDLSNPGSELEHAHRPWESQQAEGTYNATVGLLAGELRDFPTDSDALENLAEYAPLSSAAKDGAESCEGKEPLLPLWVAAIGTGTIFPIDLIAPSPECRPSFFTPCDDAPTKTDCKATALPLRGAWTLRVDEDITPPKGWAFLLFFTGLVAVLETIRFFNDHPYWGGSSERAPRESRTSFDRLKATSVARYFARYVEWVVKRYDDRPDLALLRAKYLRYAAVRGAVLAAAYAYMVSVHVLALRTEPHAALRNGPWWRVAMMVLSVSIMLYLFATAAFRIVLSLRVDARAAASLAEQAAVASPQSPRRSLGRAIRDIVAGKPPGIENALGLHVIHAGALHFVIASITVLAVWRSSLDLPAFWTWTSGWLPSATTTGVTFVLRALPLASGISAAIVVVLLAVALVVWMTYGMRRVALTHGLCLITPHETSGAPPLVGTPIAHVINQPDLVALEQRLQHVLQRPAAYRRSVLTSAVVLLVPLGAFFLKPPTTLEPGGDTIAMMGLLCVVTFTAALTTQHLVEFWFAFRALLDRLRDWSRSSIFPLAVPFVGATVSRLVTRRYKETEELILCAELARKVRHTGGLDAVEKARKELVEADPATTDGDVLRGRDLGRALVTLARNACAGTFFPEEEEVMPVSTRAQDAPQAPGKEREASPQAALVACVLGVILNRYVRHMRHFMTATSISAVVIVLVIAAYPFEPHRLMMTCAWALTLFVVGAGVGVFLGMERSAVLSFLSGTAPTEIQFSREIVVRFLTWVVLPLLSIFAAQYPQLGHLVAAFFDPLSSAFR